MQAAHRASVFALVEHLAGVGRLVIVPHGPLHAIPFSALHDGASHLIERFECSAAPSAGVWIHAQRGRSSIADDVASSGPAPSALVVGVSDGFAPRIADEARLVASLLPGAELLLDGAATAGKALAALPRADVVHIACHGRFSALAPLNSGLRLADRWLTVRDLQRLRLRASLVTLSGCDTGRSLIFGGDEMLGLLRGFLAAGASAMVVSLWTVNDTSTAELMELFYANLCGRAETIDGAAARGMHRPGAALRAAQLALLRRRPHPVHWAPFIMVGRS
ncbi:MAG: CHAT domain-containing protein [Phycisphaerales bacterium]